MLGNVEREEMKAYWPVEPLKGYDYYKIEVIVLGEDPANRALAIRKDRLCMEYGISCITHSVNIHSEDYCGGWKKEVENIIDRANVDPLTLGVVIQSPLPEEYSAFEQELVDRITPEKDVMGMSTRNLGRLMSMDFRSRDGYRCIPRDVRVPVVARGVLKTLEFIDGGYKDMNAVVLCRDGPVGRSIALLLDRVLGMTVSLVSPDSKHLLEYLKTADVVVNTSYSMEPLDTEVMKDCAILIDAMEYYLVRKSEQNEVTLLALAHNILDPLNLKPTEKGYRL